MPRDLFDGMGNRLDGSAPDTSTKPKKPKPPPPTFYEVVERFIEKHEGTDRVSQEFENLCTRLMHADPDYAAVFSCLAKPYQLVAMQFAYRLLQQKD